MKPVLRDVFGPGGPGRTKRSLKPAPAAVAAPTAPVPALARADIVHERAVLDHLEAQAADLRSLRSLLAELAVERRSEHEALAAIARELSRVHAHQQAILVEHDDAIEAEAMTRAELVGAGATIFALRDQLLAIRAEMHTERAGHLSTEGELAASRREVAKLESRLARANGKLRRSRAELEAANRRWWRRGRSPGA